MSKKSKEPYRSYKLNFFPTFVPYLKVKGQLYYSMSLQIL